MQLDVILTATDPALHAATHERAPCRCRPVPAITEREQRVLLRLAQGLTHQHIATCEQLKLRTVERTIAALAVKLQVPSRHGIIAKAAVLGLVTVGNVAPRPLAPGGFPPA